MVVEPSIRGHGFDVGDMVWAKMKSQPWWPGHVYSEEFATPLVRRSKREGLLLVALFGASCYAWFDPSELVPFDSSYAEMCVQSNSRAFVKAVEDAVVEVNRRIGLGVSCMCRNKQNFRKIDVQGFVVVDVAGYDSGAVYSIAAIGKARDGFKPQLALDFVRQLALEPTSRGHVDDIGFIKNKATVMSYRKAVFMDIDKPYDLASFQEPAPRETSSKAPLSGMAVLADSLGKVKNTAKRKDHAKKDAYIFKRRDDSKEINQENGEVASSLLPVSFKDSTSASGEFALKDATEYLEEPLTVSKFSNPCFERSTGIAESPTSFVADDEKRIVQEVEDRKVIAHDDFRGPQRSDGNYDKDLSRVLGELLSLAVDPFNTVNRGSRIKGKKAFLRFRSLVFQNSKNFLLPLAYCEPNASKSSEDNVEVPPVKPSSGVKRGLSDCQEEMNVSKNKTVADIRKLTDERNVINKIDGYPIHNVKQLVATTLKKPESGLTILNLKFQQGGYLPSFNELKARFARYGPMDHSATQILRNTFSCQVVFRHKAHAEAAYRFVVGSTSLFGNKDVKCSLKNVVDVDAAEPELSAGTIDGDESKEMKTDEEKVTSSLLVGKSGSGKSIMRDIKKQKKEDSSLVEMFSTNKTGQPEGPQRNDGNYETGLLRVLDDLHSLAVDPYNTVNRGPRIKGKKAFLRFRSLVFQKAKTYQKVPPVKPPSGLKRGPPDHKEEMAAAKKQKVGDNKNLTKEKKVTQMINDLPTRDLKQSVATTLKKPGSELIKKREQLASGPTMLTIKFPQGGSLPSYNELKARFACYGPMDHSGTHIFWSTFSCQVVFKHYVHAQAAYRFVVGSSSLFGNTGVKCTLKVVGTEGSAKPEAHVVVPKEYHHQPDMENRPLSMVPDTSGVQPKSIMKKSNGEDAASKNGRGRVKFMLGAEESQIGGAASCSSHLTTNLSTKNFEKLVHPSVVTSATSSSTTSPPPHSMHHGTTLLSPPSLPPVQPCSMQTTPLQVLTNTRLVSDPMMMSDMDVTQQMLSLLARCKDIVTNVSTILGYSPYHPL